MADHQSRRTSSREYRLGTTRRNHFRKGGPVRHAMNPVSAGIALRYSALCGTAAQRHRTAFDPEHERACPRCLRIIAADQPREDSDG